MRYNRLVIGLPIITAGLAFGHEGEHVPARDVHHAVSNRIVVSEQGDFRVIESDGIPDHQTGRFPNRGNPNRIGEQRYRFRVPLAPRANAEPTPLGRFLFGVAVNGVVFDPGAAEVWLPGQPIATRPGPNTRAAPGHDRRLAWNYEAMGTMSLGIDESHAHVQPSGAYHYHGPPTGLIERLRDAQGDDRMLHIGYAADGFPIYADRGHQEPGDAASPLKKLRSSYQLKKGDRPSGNAGPGGRYDGTFVQDYEFVVGSGDLDECNGRTGVTPEYPDGTYYYVATETFPFIPRLFRGTPNPSFEKRGPGPPPRRGDRRPPPRRE